MDAKPNADEMRLLNLIANFGGSMNHEEYELEEFCDDDAEPYDVFNGCHYKGWLRSAHSFWMDTSTVYLTDKGKARVLDELTAPQESGSSRSAVSDGVSTKEPHQ